MYGNLLIFHSYYRWVVIVILIILFLWILYHKRKKTVFQSNHYCFLLVLTFLIDIQWLLGWMLYSESPIVQEFWKSVGVGIKDRQLRFFGLEHFTMMNLGVILLNYYVARSKYHIHQSSGFTYLYKRLIWIYLIILTSIPWSFSPLTHRPNFR